MLRVQVPPLTLVFFSFSGSELVINLVVKIIFIAVSLVKKAKDKTGYTCYCLFRFSITEDNEKDEKVSSISIVAT